jgi:ubiquinone/menaquinone biosynthesis C-methylase UbiE
MRGALRYRGAVAREYEAKRRDDAKWAKEATQVVEHAMDLPAGSTALDCPVGTGRFLPALRALDLEPVGVDISPDMLAEARAKDPEVRLIEGSVFSLPLPDHSVAAAYCVRLLNWLEPQEVAFALRELARVSSGDVVVTVRLGDEARKRRGGLWLHSAQEFRRDAMDAGLRIRTARTLLTRPPGVYRFVVLAPC